MTYEKALDILRLHISYVNGNLEHGTPSREKLHQALQALEKFEGAVEIPKEQLHLHNVSGSATVDINTQVEILKKVINNLMITFDDENDRIDYILDICNEYRKEAEKHFC